jgi:hypothetical protein
MRASEDRGAEAGARAAPLVIRRTARAPLGVLLLIIATLWLGTAIHGLLSGAPGIVPGLGTSGAYLAGALGAALALAGLDWLVRGRTVVIGGGAVAVTDRSLRGRRTWREPLAGYGEVRTCRELRPHRTGVRTWYVVRLWHPDPAKALELARAKDPAQIERHGQDWARQLGLPLCRQWETATVSAGHERQHGVAATIAGKSLSAGRPGLAEAARASRADPIGIGRDGPPSAGHPILPEAAGAVSGSTGRHPHRRTACSKL